MAKVKRIPVDDCPACPELDAAVAKTLGYIVVHQPDSDTWVIASDNDALRFGLHGGMFEEVSGGPATITREFCLYLPRYSSSIVDAWELVSHSQDGETESYHHFTLQQDHHAVWWARFGDNPITDAETAPLAITRAYLKAHGIEYIEIPDETSLG